MPLATPLVSAEAEVYDIIISCINNITLGLLIYYLSIEVSVKNKGDEYSSMESDSFEEPMHYPPLTSSSDIEPIVINSDSPIRDSDISGIEI